MRSARSGPWLTCWLDIPRLWSKDGPAEGQNERWAAISRIECACADPDAAGVFLGQSGTLYDRTGEWCGTARRAQGHSAATVGPGALSGAFADRSFGRELSARDHGERLVG